MCIRDRTSTTDEHTHTHTQVSVVVVIFFLTSRDHIFWCRATSPVITAIGLHPSAGRGSRVTSTERIVIFVIHLLFTRSLYLWAYLGPPRTYFVLCDHAILPSILSSCLNEYYRQTIDMSCLCRLVERNLRHSKPSREYVCVVLLLSLIHI